MAKASTSPRKRAPRRRKADEPQAETSESGKEDGTSAWEWTAAAIGATILVAIIAALVYEGVTRMPGAHPDIVANDDPPVPLATGAFLVPIEVENHGDVTGTNVAVRGALAAPDGTVIEESTAQFDFIAQHSSARGGLYFTADPSQNRLILRVEGYADP